MRTKKILSGGVENRQSISQITLVDRTAVDEGHINPAENPVTLSNDRQELARFDKKSIICMIIGLIGLAGGITCLIFGALASSKVSEVLTFPQISSNADEDELLLPFPCLFTVDEVNAAAKESNTPFWKSECPYGIDTE